MVMDFERMCLHMAHVCALSPKDRCYWGLLVHSTGRGEGLLEHFLFLLSLISCKLFKEMRQSHPFEKGYSNTVI